MTLSRDDLLEREMTLNEPELRKLLDKPVSFTLRQIFGHNLKSQVSLSRFTTSRVGGAAEFFLEASTAEQLGSFVTQLWILNIPFKIIGGGSNILVSDEGLKGVVILNHVAPRKGVRFETGIHPPTVWVDSGVNFSLLARLAAQLGFSGLEWAVGIPGTVGGAVVGNAGAQGDDMAGCLLVADILQRNQTIQTGMPERAFWTVDELGYAYRDSRLKRIAGEAVVLKAQIRLEKSDREAVQAKMNELKASRHKKQPIGASMGSMFKNPPDDFAGRLIEAAGLKGKRIGDAEISGLHANFFINKGHATAEDIYKLIQVAQKSVLEKFGVKLELEIELLGNFESLLGQSI
jgi:UDP-N-acetylmuramate dehydrogenase